MSSNKQDATEAQPTAEAEQPRTSAPSEAAEFSQRFDELQDLLGSEPLVNETTESKKSKKSKRSKKSKKGKKQKRKSSVPAMQLIDRLYCNERITQLNRRLAELRAKFERYEPTHLQLGRTLETLYEDHEQASVHLQRVLTQQNELELELRERKLALTERFEEEKAKLETRIKEMEALYESTHSELQMEITLITNHLNTLGGVDAERKEFMQKFEETIAEMAAMAYERKESLWQQEQQLFMEKKRLLAIEDDHFQQIQSNVIDTTPERFEFKVFDLMKDFFKRSKLYERMLPRPYKIAQKHQSLRLVARDWCLENKALRDNNRRLRTLDRQRWRLIQALKRQLEKLNGRHVRALRCHAAYEGLRRRLDLAEGQREHIRKALEQYAQSVQRLEAEKQKILQLQPSYDARVKEQQDYLAHLQSLIEGTIEAVEQERLSLEQQHRARTYSMSSTQTFAWEEQELETEEPATYEEEEQAKPAALQSLVRDNVSIESQTFRSSEYSQRASTAFSYDSYLPQNEYVANPLKPLPKFGCFQRQRAAKPASASPCANLELLRATAAGLVKRKLLFEELLKLITEKLPHAPADSASDASDASEPVHISVYETGMLGIMQPKVVAEALMTAIAETAATDAASGSPVEPDNSSSSAAAAGAVESHVAPVCWNKWELASPLYVNTSSAAAEECVEEEEDYVPLHRVVSNPNGIRPHQEQEGTETLRYIKHYKLAYFGPHRIVSLIAEADEKQEKLKKNYKNIF